MQNPLRNSIIATLLASAFMSLNAGASDLLQIYKDALANDAQFGSARALKTAGQERSVQGRAGLMPTIGLGGSTTQTKSDNDPDIGASSSATTKSNGYTLTLSQPLFRWANWQQ